MFIDSNDPHVMKVWVSPTSSKKYEGQTVKFRCEVDHDEEYSLEWRWNGQHLPNNSQVVYQMELVIFEIVVSNSGLYTCMATSRRGTTTGAFGRLEVTSKELCDPGITLSYVST